MCNRMSAAAIVCTVSLGLVAGCETKAGTGALVGGAGGAAVGGAIGSMSHARAGEGALIGAAVGALGGALVGHSMDKADEKQQRAQDYDRRSTAAVADPITRADVVAWTQRGTRDEVIIDRIYRSGTVFRLSAADENDLRDRGVSGAVIRAMRDTARR